MGRDHAARTKRTGAALQGTGGITLPGTRLRISRIPESSSATTIVRSAVLPSLPAVLIGLPDCQVCRTAVCCIDRPVGLPDLPVAKSAVLPGLSETWSLPGFLLI